MKRKYSNQSTAKDILFQKPTCKCDNTAQQNDMIQRQESDHRVESIEILFLPSVPGKVIRISDIW